MSPAHRSRRVAFWTRCLSSGFVGAMMIGLPAVASAQTPTSPEGIWYTKGQESIIRVHACQEQPDAFCGNIVWMREPKDENGAPKVDKYNRDASKRNQPMLGAEILLPMTPEKDHWVGHAYNPQDGKTYDITFTVKTDHQENDIADLRGCVLGFLCKTEQFARATSVPGDSGAPAAAEGHRHRSKHDLKASANR